MFLNSFFYKLKVVQKKEISKEGMTIYICWEPIISQSVGIQHGIFESLEKFFEYIFEDYFKEDSFNPNYEMYIHKVVDFHKFPVKFDLMYSDKDILSLDQGSVSGFDQFKNTVRSNVISTYFKKSEVKTLDLDPSTIDWDKNKVESCENNKIYFLLNEADDTIELSCNPILYPENEDEDECIKFELDLNEIYIA